MREKEKPINRETYRFLQRKAAPTHLQKVRKTVWLSPENAERVRKLSRSKQISYSKALDMLLNTDDAAEICAPVKIDWKQKAQAACESHAVRVLNGGVLRAKKYKRNV